MPCRQSFAPARTRSMSFSARPIQTWFALKVKSYRDSLTARVRELGIDNHVAFFNQFVGQATLLDFISMCDVYATPYLNEAQMTSGTLAYSFGLGKAVVSTPYWHARELLDDGRGILVPFGDLKAIGSEIAALLSNDVRRHAMRKRAYAASRSMTWAQGATRYLAAFESAREMSRINKRIRAGHGEVWGKVLHLSANSDRTFVVDVRQHRIAPARRALGSRACSWILRRRQRSCPPVIKRADDLGRRPLA